MFKFAGTLTDSKQRRDRYELLLDKKADKALQAAETIIHGCDSFLNGSISKKQFDARLRRRVRELGGTDKAAEFFEISPSFMRNILALRDVPSPKFCEKMGLKPVREIKYRYEDI